MRADIHLLDELISSSQININKHFIVNSTVSIFPFLGEPYTQMSSSRVLVAQLGARRHYLVPILLQQWGVLDNFYTDFYVAGDNITKLLRNATTYQYLPNSIKKSLDRYDPLLEKAQVTHFPVFGYQYAKALKQASSQEVSSVLLWGGKEFCNRIIKRGLGNANVIYGFNGASLELFEHAKEKGIRCVLDQTLAERSLVQKILLEEEQCWPDWSLSPFTVNDSDVELMQREKLEQELADHIICGSNFVRDSLVSRGIDSNKISVVALGRRKDAQSLQCQSDRKAPQERGDGLRILFAGSVGLRKGIPYLLEALRQLKGKIPFTCKAVGSLEIKPRRVAEYRDVCNFLGHVPRSQMAELYAWADVFVLPSLCEGSAMVIYEALSYGLPVITTYNAGSIVQDRSDGLLIQIRDTEAIVSKLSMIFEAGDIFNNPCKIKNSFNDSEKKNIDILKKVII